MTAPISGRIGRSNVTDGAIVTAYQPVALATIQQLDPIYVDVPQSTTELQRLKRRLEDGRLDQNGKGQKKVTLILEDGTPYRVGRHSSVPRRHGGPYDRLGYPAGGCSQSRGGASCRACLSGR